MDRQPMEQPAISGWWFVMFFGFFLSVLAVMIAASMGDQALRGLSLYALIGVFIVGGGLLSRLVANAIGASNGWDLSPRQALRTSVLPERQQSTTRRSDQRGPKKTPVQTVPVRAVAATEVDPLATEPIAHREMYLRRAEHQLGATQKLVKELGSQSAPTTENVPTEKLDETPLSRRRRPRRRIV